MVLATGGIKTTVPIVEMGLRPKNRFVKTKVATLGAPTWSYSGKAIGKSSSRKIRLKLTQHPQTHIAIKNSTNKHFLQNLKEHFTHISVETKRKNGTTDRISLNIGSLSKRTQLSILTIVMKKLTGHLTFEYIAKAAQKTHVHTQTYTNIIQNGRTRALELGQDPDLKGQELQEVILTVMKSRKLATGILIERGGATYFAQKERNLPLKLVEKTQVLGEGSFGKVYEVHNFVNGQLEALKIAKKTNRKAAIENEYTILRDIHKNGHVEGIQDPPHSIIDLQHDDYQIGYLTSKFDFSLDDTYFLQRTSVKDKFKKCHSLFNGLNFLHKEGIVHGDIKPSNCCYKHGELQLADFGDARKTTQISLEKPLSVYTPIFTSKVDEEESLRITQTYWLHRLANGQVKKPLARAWIVKTAIESPHFKIDREAAKLYVASILMNFKEEDLKKLEFSKENFRNEIEILRKIPHVLKDKKLDLSLFHLSKVEQKKLREKVVTLCKRHDVHSLGKTIVSILIGTKFVSPKNLNLALDKIAAHPDLVGVNFELVELLKAMTSDDPAKRPNMRQAMKKYNQLIYRFQLAQRRTSVTSTITSTCSR